MSELRLDDVADEALEDALEADEQLALRDVDRQIDEPEDEDAFEWLIAGLPPDDDDLGDSWNDDSDSDIVMDAEV